MAPKISHIQPDLAAALEDLSSRLVQKGMNIHLRVIGAFALQLLGVTSTHTVDIDVIDDLDDMVREMIADVGKSRKLVAEWISDAASDVDLPDGFAARMETLTIYPSILVSFPCRQDIISLKARAFIHRGAKTPNEAKEPRDLKDLEDLTKLAPTKAEINIAIDFIRHTSSPPEPDFFPDFEDYIEVLRNAAR